jgi:hypothetical protein
MSGKIYLFDKNTDNLFIILRLKPDLTGFHTYNLWLNNLQQFMFARTAADRKENGKENVPTAANLTASSKKDFARRRKQPEKLLRLAAQESP